MPLLASGLIPASFRGAPFAVLADEVGGGRRIALHQYPGRDDPWAEDMGRAPQTFRFRGFIVDGDVTFAGGPIQLQRAILLAALQAKGSGLLTHPILGALNVSVTRFSLGQDLGAGTWSSVEVEFVEAGKKQFPSLLAAGGLLSTTAVTIVALATDAVRAIATASSGSTARRDLATTSATWSNQAVALGADATALHRLAALLPGSYGRYASGANAGIDGQPATVPTTTTIADLIAAASASRASISAAGLALGTVVATGNLAYASTIADAANALVQALAAACADPADELRLLEQLLGFTSDRPEARRPAGVAFAQAMRRAAAAQIGVAAAAYQPASADDAAALIGRLAALLDAVATEASDAGDDASFKAIRAMRVAIVQDLRARGATLARVRTFTPGAPLPALQLAQRFYRDAGRADQLVLQADPPHPLFMPPSFQALAA